MDIDGLVLLVVMDGLSEFINMPKISYFYFQRAESRLYSEHLLFTASKIGVDMAYTYAELQMMTMGEEGFNMFIFMFTCIRGNFVVGEFCIHLNA